MKIVDEGLHLKMGSSRWLHSSRQGSFPVHINLWKSKAPPRVLVFGWLMLQGSIMTMDNLQRRGMVVVNAYPLCISAKN